MSVNETGTKLTPLQLGALVVLMSEAREVTNGELEAMAGFRLAGADRRDLEAHGFVESRKASRGELAFLLTDEGWGFCKQLHDSNVDVGKSRAGRSIFVLLGGLHRSLDRLRISHADFFKQPSGTTPVPPTEVVSGGDVETQIRSTYNDLARWPGDWVGLAELRERLIGVNRAVVDTTLRAMLRQEGIRIIPVANTKALRPRDRAAALRVGDTDTHALAIGQT